MEDKGQTRYPGKHLSWSLRGGAKLHRNPEVNDICYLAASRSHTKVVRAELLAGKKFPSPKFGLVPAFSAGFIRNSPDEYSGLLRENTGNRLTFILRPSFEF